MSAARVEPESEPEFESADEGQDLAEELSQLRITPRAPPATPVASLPTIGNLRTFPRSQVLRGGSGSLLVELTGPREVSIFRLLGRTPIICTEPARFYVVWKTPGFRGDWQFAGLHSGRGTRAYEALVNLNQGFETLRFCRVSSLATGRERFLEEADRHAVNRDRVHYLFNWE